MKEKIRQFMVGRYGIDQLGQTLNVVFYIFLVFSIFTKKGIFLFIATLILIYNYFRMFSRNFSKRYNENRIFTNLMSPVYRFVDKMKRKFKIKKRDRNYKYFKCRNCKQELRIPRGKGKVTITCPKCKHSFDGRS